jgi:hypothetical protein
MHKTNSEIARTARHFSLRSINHCANCGGNYSGALDLARVRQLNSQNDTHTATKEWRAGWHQEKALCAQFADRNAGKIARANSARVNTSGDAEVHLGLMKRPHCVRARQVA